MIFMTKLLRDIDIKKKTNELLTATLHQSDTQFNSKPVVVVAMASLTISPVAEIFPVV